MENFPLTPTFNPLPLQKNLYSHFIPFIISIHPTFIKVTNQKTSKVNFKNLATVKQ
jgi:hypothetical protein